MANPQDTSVPPESRSAEMIPFHAINEFMKNTYRLTVVRSTLIGMNRLPHERQVPINQLVKKLVTVPGFRNSEKAPATVKAVPTAQAFDKSPELVGAILAAWAELHPALRQQVFDLLSLRGWSLLPIEGERTRLPGFFVQWPEGETFEELAAAFRSQYPEAKDSNDDINLMIVWVATRLPIKHVPLGQIPPLDPKEYLEKDEDRG